MSKQLIFCVEADHNSKTDWIYIKKFEERFFITGNDIKSRAIYMEGKGNYNKKKVTDKIKEWKKEFNDIGESHVIYCIDTDSIESDFERKKEFNDIKQFCINNGYELVWFHKDIEDVFWGNTISKKEKKKKAVQFKKRNQIEKVDVRNLQISVETAANSSNLYTVLKKYLKEK